MQSGRMLQRLLGGCTTCTRPAADVARHGVARAQRRVLVRHLALVDLPEVLRDFLAAVEIREHC